MFGSSVEVQVDRESVAAGDDVVSHAAVVRVRRGTRLSAVIEQVSPDVRAPGWSWVVLVDGVTAAVWSVDHGVQLLIDNRRMTQKSVTIIFRYFLQIDPAWLFSRLAQGAPPNREALRAEFQSPNQAR
ncbi:hypothetical protein V2S04_08490 [Microbacterium sp. OR21]|uniref:hypothetical protein n=1 Tax=Microbacterium sp. OR21 TaxID=3095346 RepID=UPI0039B468B2